MSRSPFQFTVPFLAAVGLACHPPVRSKSVDVDPWWLRARFQPTHDQIQGLGLRQIDSNWTAALVLTPRVMPPEAAQSLSAVTNSSVRFELDGDLNHDGLADRVLVGVYRNNSDIVGRFFLVLTRRPGGWERADLLSMPGEAGFSVLTQHADTIGWWMCMECDDGFMIAWDGRHYAPLPLPADTIQ